MRAYVGVVLIFVLYIISGFLLGASTFQTYFPFLSVILGGISLGVVFVNGRKIQESGTMVLWTSWVVLTTIPGVLFILFMKTTSKSFLFPWQLGIWGIYIPSIIIIVQVIYMIVLRVIGQKQSKDFDNDL